jgi:D-arabinose 5-phosphate isomerase GutQ
MNDRADVLLAEARDAIRREAAGVASVADQLDDSFPTVVRMLLRCQGKVFVSGSGTSGAVARRMAHLLSVCGTPSVFMQPSDALHGTMGAVTQGDLLIAISRGGGTAEINDLARRVQERGAAVIALTADRESEFGKIADVVVQLTSPPGADPGEVIAMGSTLVTAAWGDALAYVLMRLRGYRWEQVLHTHPSGAVGTISELPPELDALVLDEPASPDERR